MGHYVLSHVWKGVAFLRIAVRLFFFGLGFLGWVLKRWGEVGEFEGWTIWRRFQRFC